VVGGWRRTLGLWHVGRGDGGLHGPAGDRETIIAGHVVKLTLNTLAGRKGNAAAAAVVVRSKQRAGHAGRDVGGVVLVGVCR
jgi:hypothetical protein